MSKKACNHENQRNYVCIDCWEDLKREGENIVFNYQLNKWVSAPPGVDLINSKGEEVKI